MTAANGLSDLSSEMEVAAFRRLFPLRYHEQHLLKSVRPDARKLGSARDTTVALGLANSTDQLLLYYLFSGVVQTYICIFAAGAVASADGSALAKIGATTMLAAIKMEVMTPTMESPDEGSLAIEFHMPPICSPLVRPGRPADVASVISKQLSDTILSHVLPLDDINKVNEIVLFLIAKLLDEMITHFNRIFFIFVVLLLCEKYASTISLMSNGNVYSSGMIDLKELCLVGGKAAWMAYLDIYCLDADGALFDAALLSAVAAFSHLNIPVVSLNDDGRIVLVSEDTVQLKLEKEPVNTEKRKLKLNSPPFSLTCILHKNYILADPTAEEESIMETVVTVVLDSSYQLVSLYKPGGPVLGHTSIIQLAIDLRNTLTRPCSSNVKGSRPFVKAQESAGHLIGRI
ncbi:hypothetical protein FXO37_25241 [Capsicum annuum]|nr:hypothetical protein FXO37_25241 [Capsicum annuum]